MTEIPSWVYLICILGAVAAGVGPTVLRAVAARAPSVPASVPSQRAYSRAAWINQLCDLTSEAERLGQADVATASRALIAALVAVKEVQA